MWREWIEGHYPVHEFHPGANELALVQAEKQLGRRLPADLRALLAETNGVLGEFGLGLIWPIARIVQENLESRAGARGDAYMPFDSLLFFGDAGNGDQFGHPLVEGPRANGVFSWNHEDDTRQWVAPDLKRYLEWWSDGRITT